MLRKFNRISRIQRELRKSNKLQRFLRSRGQHPLPMDEAPLPPRKPQLPVPPAFDNGGASEQATAASASPEQAAQVFNRQGVFSSCQELRSSGWCGGCGITKPQVQRYRSPGITRIPAGMEEGEDSKGLPQVPTVSRFPAPCPAAAARCFGILQASMSSEISRPPGVGFRQPHDPGWSSSHAEPICQKSNSRRAKTLDRVLTLFILEGNNGLTGSIFLDPGGQARISGSKIYFGWHPLFHWQVCSKTGFTKNKTGSEMQTKVSPAWQAGTRAGPQWAEGGGVAAGHVPRHVRV